jgi:3-deoxy-7-phosphoheptulonate synthase
VISSKLPSPAALHSCYPVPDQAGVALQRQTVLNILKGLDKRLLLIVGPCSIHDTTEALHYAEWLASLARDTCHHAYIMMRCYVEKSRTGAGWRGLAREPQPGKPANASEGIRRSRQFIQAVSALGLPVAIEMVSPLLWPYWIDCVSWVSVGARGVESQALREAAAALPCACGFKNAMDGTADSAIMAAATSAMPSSVLTIDAAGQLCELETAGNCWPHLILRGGKQGPNIDQAAAICQKMHDKNLSPCLIVDASHGNSAYTPSQQHVAALAAIEARQNGLPIRGLMLESYHDNGSQPISEGALQPGISITDPCLGKKETKILLDTLMEKLVK